MPGKLRNNNSASASSQEERSLTFSVLLYPLRPLDASLPFLFMHNTIPLLAWSLAVSLAVLAQLHDNFYDPGECKSQVIVCEALSNANNTNPTANRVCRADSDFCVPVLLCSLPFSPSRA